MFPDEGIDFAREPTGMARFERDFTLEERSERGQKILGDSGIKLQRWRQLKEQRASLFSKRLNLIQKFCQQSLHSHKIRIVSDGPRRLDGKLEACRSLCSPSLPRGRTMSAVKRGINFNARKHRRIALEPSARLLRCI